MDFGWRHLFGITPEMAKRGEERLGLQCWRDGACDRTPGSSRDLLQGPWTDKNVPVAQQKGVMWQPQEKNGDKGTWKRALNKTRKLLNWLLIEHLGCKKSNSYEVIYGLAQTTISGSDCLPVACLNGETIQGEIVGLHTGPWGCISPAIPKPLYKLWVPFPSLTHPFREGRVLFEIKGSVCSPFSASCLFKLPQDS